MKRYRYLPYFLSCLLFCMFPTDTHARGRNVSTYDGSVDFGAQMLHLTDGCLSIDGSLMSGNFFQSLKRVDIAGHLVYRKAGNVVKEYPATVTATIRILGDKCVDALSASPSSIFGGKSYSLRLEAEWKNDMQLRPAALSTETAHCTGSSTLLISQGDIVVPSVTCQLTVDSKNVPIGDHLIVSIFAADGTPLTRLSAGP